MGDLMLHLLVLILLLLIFGQCCSFLFSKRGLRLHHATKWYQNKPSRTAWQQHNGHGFSRNPPSRRVSRIIRSRSNAITKTYQNEKSNGSKNQSIAPLNRELKYDWESQWYPLAVDECTDRSRPQSVQLLGKDLVLWHDGSAWR
eukprot:gene44377-54270_t